jgi:tRNA (guanine-N7-)-methyltransferase
LLAEALPRLAVDVSEPAPARLDTLFAAPVSQVWLEIGFGGGEHLVWQAERHPAVGFIGCEPFLDGVVKVLAAIEERCFGNIRLHAEDARTLLKWLPPETISRVFILFPDPWPKSRHHKRRLISAPFLEALARVMKPGAELRIATDVGDYARSILLAAQASRRFYWTAEGPSDWRRRPSDWPATRYEQKAAAAGRHSIYLKFLRC